MARDLAIDLGTANTLVYMKGRGIVLNEPSVIALNRQTGEVLATGREAWQMIGRTPGYIVAVRPLRGGAITDFEITERMIRLLLQRVGVSRFTRPKVVICVPSAITEVERRAVTDAARARRCGRRATDRTADGRRHRRRPADRRAGRQHGHRHRWRHQRDGCHQPRRHRRPRSGARRKLRHRRRDPGLRAPRARHRDRRAHRRRGQGGHRLGRSDRRREPGRGARPRPDERPAEDRRCSRPRRSGWPSTTSSAASPLRWSVASRRRRPSWRRTSSVRGMYLVGGGGLLRGLAQRIERETQVPVKMSTMPLEAVVHGCRSLHRALRRARRRCSWGSPLSAHPSRSHRRNRRRSSRHSPAVQDSRRVPRRGARRPPTRQPNERRRRMSIAPTGRSSRSTRPLRPISIRPSTSRWPAATCCCTTRSPTSAWFVDDGDPLDTEAWQRGVTQYLPDGKAGCIRRCSPRVRPACCRMDRARGRVPRAGRRRRPVEARRRRAVVDPQPRQVGVRDGRRLRQLPDAFAELARRIAAAEDARGAARDRTVRAGGRRRPATAATSIVLPAAAAIRGRQRGDVAGNQPGHRRRVVRRRNGLVPGHGRARPASRAATATYGASLWASNGRRRLRCATSSVR